MAIDPADLLRPARAEDAARAPLAGTRPQSMQRLQIGMLGLAAMVLLVGLADIISTNLQRNESQVVPEAAPTDAGIPDVAPVRDPLADAGVVPQVPAAPAAEPVGPAAQTGDAPSATR